MPKTYNCQGHDFAVNIKDDYIWVTVKHMAPALAALGVKPDDFKAGVFPKGKGKFEIRVDRSYLNRANRNDRDGSSVLTSKTKRLTPAQALDECCRTLLEQIDKETRQRASSSSDCEALKNLCAELPD